MEKSLEKKVMQFFKMQLFIYYSNSSLLWGRCAPLLHALCMALSMHNKLFLKSACIKKCLYAKDNDNNVTNNNNN